MRDYVNIGSGPAEEDCAQVDSDDYVRRATDECLRFISLIREKLGREPTGATLRIKWFSHDFGGYAEVVCVYDTEDKAAVDYAFKCEAEAPAKWH